MQNIKSFSDKRYLIDHANIKSGIIKYQKDFLDKNQFNDFIKNPYKGFPLLLPLGLKSFDYRKCKSFFFISKKYFYKKIYLVNSKKKIKYLDKFIDIPEWYCVGGVPKKKYKNYVRNIVRQNLQIKKKVYFLKKRFSNLIAFQTRNIPHYGHQKIIDFLLKKFNCLVINPLTGIKKKGDVRSSIIEKIYKFIIDNNYSNQNIFYLPIIANFFYAGPRESLHHLNLREMLGFENFIIGRDHAGVGNIYNSLDSYNFCKKYKKKFNIRPFLIKGAYYSKISKRIEIYKKNKTKNIINISGTIFRNYIKNKLFYKFADPQLQSYIHKIKEKIFY